MANFDKLSSAVKKLRKAISTFDPAVAVSLAVSMAFFKNDYEALMARLSADLETLELSLEQASADLAAYRGASGQRQGGQPRYSPDALVIGSEVVDILRRGGLNPTAYENGLFVIFLSCLGQELGFKVKDYKAFAKEVIDMSNAP